MSGGPGRGGPVETGHASEVSTTEAAASSVVVDS